MSYLSNAKHSLNASDDANKDWQFIHGVSKSRVVEQVDKDGKPVSVVSLRLPRYRRGTYGAEDSLSTVQADIIVPRAAILPLKLRNGEISEDYVTVGLGRAKDQHEVTFHVGDEERTVTMDSEEIALSHQEMNQRLREKHIESLAGLSDASDDNQDDDQASGPNV